MRRLLYSNGSPFARKVRIVLIEKGLAFEQDVNDAMRPIGDIRQHNPALQVPVLYDGDLQLFGSNLIEEYLFVTYPETPALAGQPPLAPSITRPDHHWEDRLTLTAIESFADTLVGLRLLLGDGSSDLPYVQRQRERLSSLLDWLEPRATAEGFWPGVFSVMDLNLMCPLFFGEKRGTFQFRTGRWPLITRMIDGWQGRPSIIATPVNDVAPPR